mgnify:FL=1
MQYGTGEFGVGKFADVTDGYGSFLYGNGTYGQFHPRVDGAAAILSSTTMVATGGFVTDGQAAITSSTAMVAAAEILNNGEAHITSSTLMVVNNSPGYVFEGEANITSSTSVVSTARPILESAAEITSVTTVTALGAVTTESGVEPIYSITTVVAEGRFKWELIPGVTDPTWSAIANPTDTWTPIN